jgi:hypothetical protein
LRESRELLHFFDRAKIKGRRITPTARIDPGLSLDLAERRDPLGEARELPRRRILVQDTACNAARHLRLSLAKRVSGLILI